MARIASLLAAALGLGIAACSWSRFDDVQADAPVMLLTKPDNVGYGFGSSVAAGEVDGFYRVFVGASPGRTGGAEFEIGSGQSTSADAARSGHCGLGCTLAKTAASLQRAVLEGLDRTLCVAEGLGDGGDCHIVMGRPHTARREHEVVLPGHLPHVSHDDREFVRNRQDAPDFNAKAPKLVDEVRRVFVRHLPAQDLVADDQNRRGLRHLPTRYCVHLSGHWRDGSRLMADC